MIQFEIYCKASWFWVTFVEDFAPIPVLYLVLPPKGTLCHNQVPAYLYISNVISWWFIFLNIQSEYWSSYYKQLSDTVYRNLRPGHLETTGDKLNSFLSPFGPKQVDSNKINWISSHCMDLISFLFFFMDLCILQIWFHTLSVPEGDKKLWCNIFLSTLTETHCYQNISSWK